MAQATVVGPLAERDLGDELRRDPMHAGSRLRACGNRLERARGLLERCESFDRVVERLHRKARAHLARVEQRAVLVVTEQQRPDAVARAFSLGEAADDQLLSQKALRFQPALPSPTDVWLISTLRDDAFETAPARETEERDAMADHVIAVAQRQLLLDRRRD